MPRRGDLSRACGPDAGPRCAARRRRPRPRSMAAPGTHEVAVRGECPRREVRAVAVVLQIEDTRKARSGEARIAPQSVIALGALQVLDPATHAVRAHLAGGHE